MTKQLVCTQCGSIVKPKIMIRGSGIVEIFLWILFFVPGFIYSLWRHSSKYPACPKCKGESLIPIDTPIAQKFISTNNPETEIIKLQEDEKTNQTNKYKLYKNILKLIGLFFLLNTIIGIIKILIE